MAEGRLLAEGVIDQRCDCDEPARWVRDDDTVFCDGCKEDDDSGLLWYRLQRRWKVVGGYDGARHALFVRGGPWLDPGCSTPVEVVSLDDVVKTLLASPDLLGRVRDLMVIDDRGSAENELRLAL